MENKLEKFFYHKLYNEDAKKTLKIKKQNIRLIAEKYKLDD